ncbi:MAG: extracellular solute-binding protein [Deltaproteobacteria bacterium]|nr:extracellular solute-binding protein [Deltaproteobacteria bacterium]
MTKLASLLLALLVATALMGILLSGSIYASMASSQETMAQRETRLIEGAKKEGKLVHWSSSPAKETEQLLAKFRQKYPFLKTEYWRAGSADRHQKFLSEARAGVYNADVSVTDLEYLLELKKARLMKKHDWPNTKGWSPNYRDSDGYWVARNILPVVIAYNTTLVSAAEAPKGWKNLLDPKWKGTLSIDKDAGDWVLMLWAAWGKEEVVSYLRQLSKNNPILGSGVTAQAQMLAAGAFKIDARMNLNFILEYQEKGAPLEWVRSDPVLAKGTPMFIAEHAPHPNAAMLFADWLTSLEGQQGYYDISRRVVPHPGVRSRLADAIKTLKVVFTPAELAVHGNEANKIFQEIFWK